ncbi:MAG: hypothetical protein U0W40_11235 [Acidimicrobiia bacterium]
MTSDVGWLQQDFLVDPYPRLAELREQTPVFFDEELGYYVVTRYDDIERCLVDRTTFLAQGASSPVWPPVEEAQRILTEQGYKRVPTLNNADPPRHGPMRKAVFTCMSRARLASLEPELREYATELVTTLVEQPVADLIADLAFPLPGRAGLGLLGIPVQDFDQIKAWSGGRVLFTYGHLPEDEQVQVAHNVIAFWQYVEQYVSDRDRDRGDDFTSDILRYRDEHPDEVTTDDVVNIVYSMALAGHDSTTNAMGNMLRHLLAHQDEWRRWSTTRRSFRTRSRKRCGSTDRSRATAERPPSTPRSAACRSRRVQGSCCCSAPPTATRSTSPTPTASTCGARTRRST